MSKIKERIYEKADEMSKNMDAEEVSLRKPVSKKALINALEGAGIKENTIGTTWSIWRRERGMPPLRAISNKSRAKKEKTGDLTTLSGLEANIARLETQMANNLAQNETKLAQVESAKTAAAELESVAQEAYEAHQRMPQDIGLAIAYQSAHGRWSTSVAHAQQQEFLACQARTQQEFLARQIESYKALLVPMREEAEAIALRNSFDNFRDDCQQFIPAISAKAQELLYEGIATYNTIPAEIEALERKISGCGDVDLTTGRLYNVFVSGVSNADIVDKIKDYFHTAIEERVAEMKLNLEVVIDNALKAYKAEEAEEAEEDEKNEGYELAKYAATSSSCTLSAKQLASQIGCTKEAARGHLKRLMAEGIIQEQANRQGFYELNLS
jgi:hypothetical protein